MRRFLLSIFSLSLIVIPVANIINFVVNNKNTVSNDINDILYPSRGWPEKNQKSLNIWKALSDDTLIKVNQFNTTFTSDYQNFYLKEFNKYRATEEQNAGKPGYDSIGIPLADLNQYFQTEYITNHQMQLYMALTLRGYFLEFTINQINNPAANYISDGENLNLWTMKYFNAGIYYQWIKIWIADLGRTIEKDVNVDYYTFGSLVASDAQGNPLWNQGPTGSATPLLKLDKNDQKMINYLYDHIMKK